MKIPTVHLNGTSKNELLSQLEKACGALSKAIEAVRAAAPHGRDYYVQQDPNAFNVAATEHLDRIDKLVSVQKELESIWVNVFDQE